MKREAICTLEKWKNNPAGKPMLLLGARQVGKTWLMKEFGRTHYEQIAYIRLDKDEEMKQQFTRSGYNISSLLTAIEAGVGFSIMVSILLAYGLSLGIRNLNS